MQRIKEDEFPNFVEVTVEGYTENLKPCPNPLCQNKEITVLRSELNGTAQYQTVCKLCKTTSPKSKRVKLEELDHELNCKLAIAVIMCWNKLNRYSIGVKRVDNDVICACPWCKREGAVVNSTSYKNQGWSMVVCINCEMAGAGYPYEPNKPAEVLASQQQAVFAWNLLEVNESDDVE